MFNNIQKSKKLFKDKNIIDNGFSENMIYYIYVYENSISIKQVEHENVKNKSAWRCQSSEKLLHYLRLFSCSVIA